MAEIDVQPKKRSGSILPWLLLGFGVVALLTFLLRKKDGDNNSARENQTTTLTNTSNNAAASDRWSAVDWNAAPAHYSEIEDQNIEVRGGDKYAIYGLGENILFDKDAATIKSSAESNLKQIAESINKRYKGGDVKLYGFTDAAGSEEHNQQLSQQRAEAVRSWLAKHGNISDDHITVQAEGESHPVASNGNESGKQQNRRVEIVALKD